MLNKKANYTTIGIIVMVIILAIIIITIRDNHPETPEEIAKCIGENSILYTKTGCSFCEKQKALFGDNLDYLNTFNSDDWDTLVEKGVTKTPTWIINEKKYEGYYSIEKLQELTGC